LNKGILGFKRTSTLAGLGGFFFLLIFSISVLVTHGGDPNSFIFIGNGSPEAGSEEKIAYDGLTAYYIVIDPLHGYERIHPAAYRYQRMLYPSLAWLFSFGGNRQLIPWVMLLINLLATAVSVGLIAEILAVYHVPVWHAAAFLVSSGVLISVRTDLTEPLAILFALLGLLLSYRRRWIWSGLSFALAILAKEIAVTFALGVIIWLLLRREFSKGGALFVISFLPAILWGIMLTLWLGQSPLSAEQAAMNLVPFRGIWLVGASPAKEIIIIWVIIPVFVFGAVGLYDLIKKRISVDLMVLLGSVALIACMPNLTWMNASGALRTVINLTIASLVYSAIRWPRILPWVGAYWMASGLIMIPILIIGPY
jgi:hypothetical protein